MARDNLPEIPAANEATKKVARVAVGALLAGVGAYWLAWGAGLEPEVDKVADALGLEDVKRTDTVTDTTYKTETETEVVDQKAGAKFTLAVLGGSLLFFWMTRAFIIGMRDASRAKKRSNQ